MSSPPESEFDPPESEGQPSLRRENRRYALVIVLLIHLALLAAVLLSRSRVSEPPPARSVEVVLFEQKVPEKKIHVPPPDVAPPKLAPPPLALPPLPVLDIVPDAIRAPPAPAAPPAPPPAAAPPPPVKEAVASAPPKLFEECAEESDRHMIADVYRLAVNNQSVSEMRRRKPIKRVCMAQLNITPRSFKEGFPGLGSTNEWFGLDIRFTVNIPETATYELMLLADDGAMLSVDDENVIDNDGIHAPTPVATKIKLEKGLRNFRVRYFQGPGPDLALMLAWKKPGATDYGYIPRSLIGRPPAGTLPQILAKE
ncbi:PA14 domain-containing protein [Devosia sp.]|uniref:PA14 domain-containing protein n=1 Tax=Devosia sp. TaxID=1871048 RepID=UPI002FC985EA